MSLQVLLAHYFTYFVTLSHIADLFLCHWIYSRKCLSTNRIHEFIIDKNLFDQGEVIIKLPAILSTYIKSHFF